MDCDNDITQCKSLDIIIASLNQYHKSKSIDTHSGYRYNFFRQTKFIYVLIAHFIYFVYIYRET